MRSVALLIAPLLTLLLYSGPALAGQRSSPVIVGNSASQPTFVVPHSPVVIVGRPFVTRPLVVERPLARPFAEPRTDRQILIIRRSDFGPPVVVERRSVPQGRVHVFDTFGGPR